MKSRTFSAVLRDRSRVTIPIVNLKVIAKELGCTVNDLYSAVFTFEIGSIRLNRE